MASTRVAAAAAYVAVNLKQLWKNTRTFIKETVVAAKNFVWEIRHMIFIFGLLTMLMIVMREFRTALIHGGKLAKIFLDLITYVVIVIYDAIGFCFKAINKVSSFFTGHNALPTLPAVSPKYFFADADLLDSIQSRCALFTDPWFDLLFPVKHFMSPHVCDVYRYIYRTSIGKFVLFFVQWMSFNPNPDLTVPHGNCEVPADGYFCLAISLEFPLGDIVLPWYWPAMILIYFNKPILDLVYAAIDIIKDLFVTLIVLCHYYMHAIHRLEHRTK